MLRHMFKQGWLLLMLAAALLSTGCPDKQSGSTGDKPKLPRPEDLQPQVFSADGKPVAVPDDVAEELKGILPVPRGARNYKQLHADAAQAWFLVETSYYVLGEKLNQANELLASTDPAKAAEGLRIKEAVTAEINKNIFNTNPNVVQLFEAAIKAEPDNPLNMVAYAVYLKPRRKPDVLRGGDTEPRALELMDEAIKLWPDDSGFYFVKAQMLVTAQRAGDYFRSTALEEEMIAERMPEVRELLAKAELYDPDNAAVNYYRAQLAARFVGSDPGKARAEALREIRAGNKKREIRMALPPPVPMKMDVATDVKLSAANTEAVWYDFWKQYGWYDLYGLGEMVKLISQQAQWPQDRSDIRDLLYCLHRLGSSKPGERTFFSWVQLVLTSLRDNPRTTPEEKAKLAAALFILNDQYVAACQQLAVETIAIDPLNFGAQGLNEAEINLSRHPKLKEIVQPYFSSFLKVECRKLGMEFKEISDDPSTWSL